MNDDQKKSGPLGRNVSHSSTYDPGHLFSIPRADARRNLGNHTDLPFYGVDFWNCYEISWLNRKGMPQVAIGTLKVEADSVNIVESKSLKLYLNSLNQTVFDDHEAVGLTIERDLQDAVAGKVSVSLHLPGDFQKMAISPPTGMCLDRKDIKTETYLPNPSFLVTEGGEVREQIHSNLLRTLCPVTGQPDWATIMIDYQGAAIDHLGLLRYIVSFREHTGFHENCVERIFVDIKNRCQPNSLTVTARFTRRGGIDINPVRSSAPINALNSRLARQ